MGLVFQDPNAQIVGQTVSEDIAFGLENIGTPPCDIPKRVEAALSTGWTAVPTGHARGNLIRRAEATALRGRNAGHAPGGHCLRRGDCHAKSPHSPGIITSCAALREEGDTVLWVTQWLDELACADRVIALANGHKVYDGTVPAFFERKHGQPSACEQLGFSRPFVVEVADELRRAGMELTDLPLTPESLAMAVVAR